MEEELNRKMPRGRGDSKSIFRLLIQDSLETGIGSNRKDKKSLRTNGTRAYDQAHMMENGFLSKLSSGMFDQVHAWMKSDRGGANGVH